MNIHLALRPDLALGQHYEDVNAPAEGKPMKLLRPSMSSLFGRWEG
ncbi:hypothetical protein [Rhizobium sophoriradicis]|nr:hypothetical protein [Rhizobium sophoriradicis]